MEALKRIAKDNPSRFRVFTKKKIQTNFHFNNIHTNTMKTLQPINYERFMEPEFTAPLDFIPDPWPGATVQQIEWYYKICQLTLDEAVLTHCSRLYVQDLIMRIDRLPEKPTTPQVNEYIKMTTSLAFELGLSLEQIQKAGVPVLY